MRLMVAGLLLAGVAMAQQPRIFNTVKTKLAQGKQVVGEVAPREALAVPAAQDRQVAGEVAPRAAL